MLFDCIADYSRILMISMWFISGSCNLYIVFAQSQCSPHIGSKLLQKGIPTPSVVDPESKIEIYLYLGLLKGHPSYRRSLQPSKKTYSTLKKMKCFFFWGHFCPPGSGTNLDPDPQHFLLPVSYTVYSAELMLLISLIQEGIPCLMTPYYCRCSMIRKINIS
jgi:hypothetical protein